MTSPSRLASECNDPPPHGPVVAGSRFRSLMTNVPAGVTVVTAMGADGHPRGMTCTALASVSDQPPTLLVCVHQSSRTLAAIGESSRFAVNLLHRHARPVAERFASARPDRFASTPWEYDASRQGGPHLPEHAHTVADCRVTQMVRAADHTAVFAEVFAVTGRSDRHAPLLYARRDYWALDNGDSRSAAERYATPIHSTEGQI